MKNATYISPKPNATYISPKSNAKYNLVWDSIFF